MKKTILSLSFMLLYINLFAQYPDRSIIVGEYNTTIKEKRLALVIGNNEYTEISKLSNPINDASEIKKALKKCGFDVIEVLNADKKSIMAKVREFSEKLKTYDVGMLYYSGHGVEVNGYNYIVPIDIVGPATTIDIEEGCVATDFILKKMGEAGSMNKTFIMVLDACRNNPFKNNYRNLELETWKPPTDVPSGSITCFAASQGEKALDGIDENSNNSPYTKLFLKHMLTPGLELEDIFKRIRIELKELAKNNKQLIQEPVEVNKLTGDFYFVPSNNITPEIVNPDINLKGATLKILSNVSGELKIDGVSKGSIEKDNIKVVNDLNEGEYYIQLIPDNGWIPINKTHRLNSQMVEILKLISVPMDKDGDGVEDNKDDCPDEKGLISLNGCPDSDDDGISNIEDECPLLPGDTKNYGCPNVAGMSFIVGVNTTIGCKPCGNQREVTLRNYYISNYEITVGEFKEFIEKSGYVTDAEKIGSSYIGGGLISVERKNISWKFDENGKKLKGDYEKRPVIHVSINDAEAYCKWLSQSTGKLYRLPNEAEWEYAANVGNLNKKYNYSNGDDINNRNVTVYYDSNSRIESVGKYKPNEIGLYDMMENVSEWCYNFYDSEKVVSRGRSFKDFSQNFSVYTRSSNQLDGKDMRDNKTGFRILLVQ
jgi:formylglycine-generating enzyme required for sulfatase activity/uncharacterized caspase-like protein